MTCRGFFYSLGILCLFLFSPLAVAANGVQHKDSSLIEFSPGSRLAAPDWQLDESQLLHFNLPSLTLQRLEANGQTWQALSIEGAAIQGDPGYPGIPVLSRLVAVPQGMTLKATVTGSSSSNLADVNLIPVQDPNSDIFAFEAQAYARKKSVDDRAPLVQVGKPAIMAGQTVVPLVIHPVAFDPVSQRVKVWNSIEAQLEFVPSENAGAFKNLNSRIPQSFVRQLTDQVLGFDATRLNLDKEGGIQSPSLGTYVAVHNGSASVVSGIAPLLKWRKEQGYRVVEVNTFSVGNNTNAIKNELKSIYNDTQYPAMEFITIFGDVGGDFPVPSYTENLSGYGGGGDHYYTMLEGDDILADVHIGRVSVRSSSQLNTVVDKILNYEINPPMDDTGWFGRAMLQGDPSASGITTITTNQWLKSQLLDLGWTQVDTTWSGNFVSEMFNAVGSGVSVYGYRGYLGTSGISNGHVEALTNGGRLPVALLPTCDSGSFVGSTTSRSEAWLRAANGGAIAAVGTATLGTHTRYNNCYYLGTWDDLLNGSDHRIGVAHTSGKVALYRGYFLAEPDVVEIWSVWNNVMGDGATEMWTGVPQYLTVDHPVQVSLGAQAVPLNVSHASSPLANSRVSLYQASSGWQGSALTDGNGQVFINIPALEPGPVTITVTGHNFIPYQSGFTVGQADVFCNATGHTITSGADAIVNPGELATLTAVLTNQGITDAFGVTAQVTVLDGPASISSSSLNFGTIGAGLEMASANPVQISISNQAQDGDIIRLLLTATDGNQVWTSIIEEVVQAADFLVANLDLSGFDGSIDPGESGFFAVTLQNDGSLDATGITATLECDSPWINIGNNTVDYGNITSGNSGSGMTSPFSLTASNDSFGGHLAGFTLTLTYNGGWQTTIALAATIGTATSDQPTGPDTFGYYAFDNTDVSSPMAPVYDWVGIDPDHGGQGTDLGLTDFGWEQDDTKVMDLPFEFSFYGEAFNRVSICSNGWIAMGESQVVFYRNFPLPSSHSPDAMIAPFWDNLNQTGNKRVYTWYDEVGHRFIIQWYGMLNHYSNLPQNFEVILLDPAFHPTSTGDGMILFQYEEVNNTDARDGYATVGIQNRERSVGLNYSYWNQYSPGAAPLESGRAILFAPIGDILLPSVAVTPASISQSIAPGGQVAEYLHISNQGDEGSLLGFQVTKVDPALFGSAKTGEVLDEQTVQPSSLVGSYVQTTVTEYEPGQTLDIPLYVHCSSPDDEWIMVVEVDAPDGVTVNSATNLLGMNMVIPWNGESGNGVMTTWGAFESGNYLSDSQSGNATLNLSFSSQMTGAVELEWSVHGDDWGSAPHSVSGTMVIETTSPQIQVTSPTVGQVVEIGSDLAVEFDAFNGPQMVNIELQREVDGPWVSLAADVPATASPWVWSVTGEPGPYAMIRVSDASDGAVFGLSGIFGIGQNLDWLQLTATSGEVPQGQTVAIALTLDATGLSTGLYEALIMVESNGGLTQMIPVTMNVNNTSPVFDLPSAVTLMGNYPNPFNPQTLISFSLPADQQVSLNVYSIDGRLVRSLLGGVQPAGIHRVVWDGKNSQGQSTASGVYFYRLNAGAEVLTGKMMLTK